MSLWQSLIPRTVKRSPANVRRALLDLDAGDLLTPTAYPYTPGMRPVAPFAGRILHPGHGERPRAQLYPPTGNPTQRRFAHIDYVGRAAQIADVRGDRAGNRQPAKIVRTRPWLYAGGSSATTATKLAAAAGPDASSPCEGCG